MARNTRTAGRVALVALVDSLAAVDRANDDRRAAEAALVAAWDANGDAVSAYIVGHFGDGLPVAGKPAADSPESLAWPAILGDLGVTGPEDDGYSAARKRVQRIRWAVLLRAATGAPWAECGRAARDFGNARTLVARGADAVVRTPLGDGTESVSLPGKPRAASGSVNVTDSTPVTPGATAPTPTDVAVQAVAASTDRTMADTLHAVADRVARALPVDPAVRAAMIADARAILAALEAEVAA